MNWQKHSDTHLRSDPDGYTITRSVVRGVYTYQAIRLGKRWTSYTPPGKPIKEGFDGSVLLAIERDIPMTDRDARASAIARLQAVCVVDAATRDAETPRAAA